MKFRKLIAILAFTFLPTSIASAEILEIDASGDYTMGENESQLAAKALAREVAYRSALMQAGVYIESRSEMVDHIITKDEVRAVAATILKIPDGNETYDREFVGNGGIKITCNIHAIIDTEKVDLAAIAGDKRNLEIRTGMMNEVEQLQQKNLELQEKLSKAESDVNLQRQFVENQKKFLVKSYESMLFEKLCNEQLDLETINRLSEIDPEGFKADYFEFEFHKSHDNKEKMLESAKQCIRKIRKAYTPEQIKKNLAQVLSNGLLSFRHDVDVYEFLAITEIYMYLCGDLGLDLDVHRICPSQMTKEDVDAWFLKFFGTTPNGFDFDNVSEIYNSGEIIFVDCYFDEEV
ncbi:MAG: hypothetical protein IJ575_00460 [Selenomonadaceae bacterium]|nr:hypothetical protein [Selenomonadaceae bacterium]